jgi:hypothetical protein
LATRAALHCRGRIAVVSRARITTIAIVIGLVLVGALAAWIALGGVISGAPGPRHRVDRDAVRTAPAASPTRGTDRPGSSGRAIGVNAR